MIIDFAINLRALGVKEGVSVGICCENRLEFACTMYGVMLLNATLAPCNVTYTERKYTYSVFNKNMFLFDVLHCHPIKHIC